MTTEQHTTPSIPGPPPFQVQAYPYPYPMAQPKADGLAIAGMVLGICGFFFGWLYLIPCVIGIVLSGVGLNKVNKSNGRRSGKGMAIAGLTCSIVSFLFYGIIFLAASGFVTG